MLAYDLAILPHPAERATPDCHGWCFGLPPGITSEQWPLDPANGYPLQHGFTLLLPKDYRCHGPEIVAVSFFASAVDHNDGGPDVQVPEIAEAMAAAQPPGDRDLLPFWQAERGAHPRLHRMEDMLGTAYAAILLTAPEFAGPPCRPPRLDANPHRDLLAPPNWMSGGTGTAFWSGIYRPGDIPKEGYGLYCMLGEEPDSDLAWNRALRWTARANDANAGKAPWNEYGGAPPTGYDPSLRWADEGDEASRHPTYSRRPGRMPNHIGGTMRPVQEAPAFSPYYVEFEEYLGSYNFGGGNAQLDIYNMKFEWACG